MSDKKYTIITNNFLGEAVLKIFLLDRIIYKFLILL